jgi:hypothetical protein
MSIQEPSKPNQFGCLSILPGVDLYGECAHTRQPKSPSGSRTRRPRRAPCCWRTRPRRETLHAEGEVKTVYIVVGALLVLVVGVLIGREL